MYAGITVPSVGNDKHNAMFVQVWVNRIMKGDWDVNKLQSTPRRSAHILLQICL